MVRRFGVDEAGKGPVFGPMVVCAIVCDPAELPTGIDDSKKISPTRRTALSKTLRNDKNIEYNIIRVSPEEIDNGNMNDLTKKAFAEALAPIVSENMAGTVDASETDTGRFKFDIKKNLDTDVIINSEHGADESDPVVGAASIIAKVERDNIIEELKEEYGDIGSGYPSDETTRDFLETYVRRNGELPPFARKSWKTSKDALENYSQKNLDKF